MSYMLVRLDLNIGKVSEFSEIMSHMVPVLERHGWHLRGAFVNRIGKLNRCYDLWEMPDANAVSSVLEIAGQDPEFSEWSDKLQGIVISEELELMEKLPYWIAKS
tara:strand:- start:174 stop:488 length:315 start_codon:yes stop_codon:yes gene_type:complete